MELAQGIVSLQAITRFCLNYYDEIFFYNYTALHVSKFQCTKNRYLY